MTGPMNSSIGSAENPLRVAIVGTGPSGMYAAGSLLDLREKSDLHVTVDLFDKLPAPFGLVRYGVAPDHQKIKLVSRVFDKTARDERVRFFGNVMLGGDLSREDLQALYHQIVYAVGAQTDRELGIPGEGLEGSLSSTEFVAWYNCHPDLAEAHFPLDHERVAVVGIGNVAIDVTRILAKSPEELATTDISDAALEELRTSPVEEIFILARRGPVQAKCSPQELKEIGEIEGAQIVVDPEDLDLDAESESRLEDDRAARKNLEIWRQAAGVAPESGKRHVHFRFYVSPVEILDEDGRVAGVRLRRNRLEETEGGYLRPVAIDEREILPVTMIVRAIGYRSEPLADLPYDPRTATIPNREGRVVDPRGEREIVGEYVVGWVKRGPTGLIGTNKLDARETVETMEEDLEAGRVLSREPISADAVVELLEERQVRRVRYEDWLKLDALEVERGERQGRPRVKFPRVEEMLLELEAEEA